MAINLHHLRLFATVVQEGGFTKAAAKLNLSQPAISKSLTELERQLDVNLIDRTGRTIRLTDAGRTLYARARELFGVELVAEEELRELRGLKRGTLRIAASTTIATYMLPAYLGRFHALHPGVRIQTTSANTRTVLRMLVEFRVDVALVEGPVSKHGVVVQPWRQDDLIVIAHPHHVLCSRARIGPEELVREVFLVREPGSGTRAVTEAAFARLGVRLEKTMRVGGTEAIKQAVAAGLGIAIVSRAAAADQIMLGRVAVLTVEGLAIRRTLAQIKLHGRASTASARELERILAEAIDGESIGDASGDAGLLPVSA